MAGDGIYSNQSKRTVASDAAYSYRHWVDLTQAKATSGNCTTRRRPELQPGEDRPQPGVWRWPRGSQSFLGLLALGLAALRIRQDALSRINGAQHAGRQDHAWQGRGGRWGRASGCRRA